MKARFTWTVRVEWTCLCCGHGNNRRGQWDEWLHDLRAQVEALEDAGCRRVVGGCTCRRSGALRDVLVLLDGGGPWHYCERVAEEIAQAIEAARVEDHGQGESDWNEALEHAAAIARRKTWACTHRCEEQA